MLTKRVEEELDEQFHILVYNIEAYCLDVHTLVVFRFCHTFFKDLFYFTKIIISQYPRLVIGNMHDS